MGDRPNVLATEPPVQETVAIPCREDVTSRLNSRAFDEVAIGDLVLAQEMITSVQPGNVVVICCPNEKCNSYCSLSISNGFYKVSSSTLCMRAINNQRQNQ